MFAIVIESKVYAAFAVGVLLIHALFVAWVLAGTLLKRLRPIFLRLDIASLVWGHLRGSSSRSVPFNLARELARKPGWRSALPRWVSASLPGCSGISGHFRHGAHDRRRRRVSIEPRCLRETILSGTRAENKHISADKAGSVIAIRVIQSNKVGRLSLN